MISDAESCLLCPNCNQRYGMPVRINDVTTDLVCRQCGYRMNLNEGIPDFLGKIPLNDQIIGKSQKFMNSSLFSALYETPFWRPLHTFIGSGITWKQEIELVLSMVKAKQPAIIADLACGTGHYARAFSRSFPDAIVYALDISQNMLLKGKKKASGSSLNSIHFLKGSIYHLPFDNSSVDIVNCSGALHLFPDVDPILGEISRVLKSNGEFTAMTISRSSGWVGNLQKRLLDDRKATFFSPDRLCSQLKKYGFNQLTFIQNKMVLLFRALKDIPVDN